MSDIGFQEGQIWDKMVNLHIAGSVLWPHKLRKAYKWAWLVALTDGFDFQKEKHLILFLTSKYDPPNMG